MAGVTVTRACRGAACGVLAELHYPGSPRVGGGVRGQADEAATVEAEALEMGGRPCGARATRPH